MLDNNENTTAKHQLAECCESDSSARQISQKQFQPKDGTIKVAYLGAEQTVTPHAWKLDTCKVVMMVAEGN